jgi:hypothetical protein
MNLLKGAITIALLTGCVSCVSPSSVPTADISTIEKMGIDDKQRSLAGYSHWQSHITKVINIDTGEDIYQPSEFDMINPFADMYLRVPPGNYLVTARCGYSQRNQMMKSSYKYDDIKLQLNGNEKIQLKVTSGCKSSVNIHRNYSN